MKTFLIWVGIVTLVVSLSHGFITEQSIAHSLLFHPVVIILSFALIAFGIGECDVDKKTEE